ncbi:MAG: NAD-dependent epimerase/dehydratase family protein [Myxococcota bacterium]
MSVLITGATGLLGANLAHRLARAGVRPRVLVRERSDRRGLSGLSFDECLGDVLDGASLRRAMEGATCVVHAAGLVRLEDAAAKELFRVNVEGTRAVLEAARASGVRRLLHVSSVATISPGTLADPATEDSPCERAGGPYAQSKLEAERLALAGGGDGLEVVVANPSFVIGPYDVRPTSGELLLAVAQGWLAVYPSGGTNFVHAADVAQGLFLALEHGRAGERYILGGENLTYRQLLCICAEEAGVRPPWVPLSEKLTRATSFLAHLASTSPRMLAPAFLTAMFRPAYYSSAKAARELGYLPRPVRLGVREAYRWFQEEGYLPRDRPLSPRAEAPSPSGRGLG